MRSTPDQDAKLKALLEKAVAEFAGGSADKFGQMIGFANGGSIRQCIGERATRPVRESIITRVHAHDSMRGWFDAALTPISAGDAAKGDAQRFESRLSQQARVLGSLLDLIADETLKNLAFQRCLQICAEPRVLLLGASAHQPPQQAPSPLHRPPAHR